VRQLPLPGMESLLHSSARKQAAGGRAEHFHGAVQQHAPGQGVLTYDEPQRFRGREVDPRNVHFNDEPSAHVEAHGFIRDNTATTKQAYKLRGEEHWAGAEVRELQPNHPLHTLQTERETARASSRLPGSGPTRPRVMRIRGKDVLVDGHHRVAAARAAGKPIKVDHVDMDAEVGFGMKARDLHGV